MSARCLQTSSRIGAGTYKKAGVTVLTVLAMGQCISSSQEDDGTPLRRRGTRTAHGEPPSRPLLDASRNTESSSRDTEASSRDTEASSRDTEASSRNPESSSPSISILPVDKGSESKAPFFLQPRTRMATDKSAAFQEILELVRQGKDSAAQTRTAEEFPDGSFKDYLLIWVRESLLKYQPGTVRNWKTSVLTPYVKAFKTWCADSHDALVEHLKLAYKCSDATADDLGLTSTEYNAMISDYEFFEKVRETYHSAVESLRQKVLRDRSSDLSKAWEESEAEQVADQSRVIRMASNLGAYPSVRMIQDARFVSWLLRSSPPELFLTTRLQVAETVKILGGDSKLVNVLYSLCFNEADVAEIMSESTELRKSTESGEPVPTSFNVEQVKLLPEDPLQVLDSHLVDLSFASHKLPPFLQLVTPVRKPKYAAFAAVLDLHGHDKINEALDLIRESFPDGDFNAHCFTILREKLREYRPIPVRPGGPSAYTTGSSEPRTCLERLMRDYILGLQLWCHDNYNHHVQRFDESLDGGYTSETLESYNSIAFRFFEKLPVNLYERMATQVRDTVEGERDQSVELYHFRQNVHHVKWMLLHLPWETFLYYRHDFARLVREHNSVAGGFGFLANVLESLSFASADEIEFSQHCSEVQKRVARPKRAIVPS